MNGEEVSARRHFPASGYLCLESEERHEFRNIRLRSCPPRSMRAKFPPSFLPPPSTSRDTRLGTWKYLKSYSREVREDGVVILRNGESVIWKKDAFQNRRTGGYQGNYVHKLIGELLHIEGRHKATK